MRLANASLLIVTLGLTACATANSGTPELLVEPLAQGVLAGELGAELDDKTRMAAARAEYRALETGGAGSPVAWRISESVFGTVVPQQPFLVGRTDCRRYVHTVNNEGDVRSAAGTACRGADGVWRPVS